MKKSVINLTQSSHGSGGKISSDYRRLSDDLPESDPFLQLCGRGGDASDHCGYGFHWGISGRTYLL